jgi:hypothetical protein
MISVVTYGRNDGHGYNLPKRAALSFNCIAELLDEDGDEILFVDCNSEDEYATFPESIADTLTPKARRLLRVFRVRRSLYEQRTRGAEVPVLESFSRNIALRRANPQNRWVLSTNPDIVLLPAPGRTLKQILAELPDGYYATPRYELPESLWEAFDRSAPAAAMQFIRQHAQAAGLHIAVRGDPWNGYDAPGDFQLAPLRHFLEIGGFHEGMVKGRHVDSNLARRFSLFYGQPAHSLHDRIHAYHMMHLRTLTWQHTGDALRRCSSLRMYVRQVRTPYPKDQAPDWGAPEVPVEEISLAAGKRPFWALSRPAEGTPGRFGEDIEFVDYTPQNGSTNASWHANLDRVQLFLVNAFDHLPAGLRAGLWSGNLGLQEFMHRVAREKRWELSLVCYLPEGGTRCVPSSNGFIPDLCLFDFTVHFIPTTLSAARQGELRQAYHGNLLNQLRHMADLVAQCDYRVTPTLYCIGVTHTELEAQLESVTLSWDHFPFPLGFKRGRLTPSDRANKLHSFALSRSGQVRMAANARGHKTLPDKIQLECLRLLQRISSSH